MLNVELLLLLLTCCRKSLQVLTDFQNLRSTNHWYEVTRMGEGITLNDEIRRSNDVLEVVVGGNSP
jgi:hypothetical protein